MLHLPERYSLAAFRENARKQSVEAALQIERAARFVAALATDYALSRSTTFTWGQARLARDLGFNLTIARDAEEIRNALVSRMQSIPFKNQHALHQRFRKHFPQPERSK